MTDQDAIKNLLTYLPHANVEGESAPSEPQVSREPGQEHDFADVAWQVLAAHVIELEIGGVLDASGFRIVASALDRFRVTGNSHPTGLRRVIADVDERVNGNVAADMRGAATLGLAREEWVATAARICWRSGGADLYGALVDIRDTILDLADVHAVTIMPAFLGGRPAQPTTLAHFLGGVIAPLGMAADRLQRAIEVVDRSPLGAGLLSGELVASDRTKLAARLGFRGVVPNTLDALMSVEDFVEVADAVVSTLAPARRFVREMANWIRTDPTSFLVDETWTSHPEPGQPLLLVAEQLDHLMIDLQRLDGRSASLISVLRELPFAPLSSAWDVVAEEGVALLRDATTAIYRFGAFFDRALIVNRAYLGNRAGRGYTTAGDLAAFLMSEEQVPPGAARHIASLVLTRLEQEGLEVSGITPDRIDSAALITIGRELKVEMEAMGRFLSPRRFLERRQVLGSPAPEMTRAWLAAERDELARDRAWLHGHLAHTGDCMTALSGEIAQAAVESD